LKAYPSYKDSGVEWIGEIPSTWTTIRTKYIFAIKKKIAGVMGYDVLSVTQNGIIIKDIITGKGQLSMDYTKYQIVDVGDFVMNHMDLLTGYVDISKFQGVTSPDYRCFSITQEKCVEDYYLYLFQMGYRNRIFYRFGQGSSMFGRWRLPTTQFHNFKFPSPAYDEQLRIATFLRSKIPKIDKLIGLTKQKIEFLKEQRSSLINQCVTKGLNPNVELKDSRVKWIGEIPSHWKEMKLKYFASVTLGKMLTPTDKGGFHLKPYLRSFNVQIEKVKTSNIKQMWFSTNELKKYRLKRGDLLFNEGGDVGRTCIWNDEIEECYIQNSVNMVRLVECDEKFILYQSTLHHYTGFYDARVDRVSIPHLTKEKLESIPFAIPSLSEQEDIIEFLDEHTQKIDSTIELESQRIELLKEYRQALISEVVTGKIDVRDEVIA